MKTIWGHTLVKNEERFLWFVVTSVIGYLDKLLLWDTGSSDKTLEIIELLIKKYPQKISFREFGEVDVNNFTLARQKMLGETKSDWFFILDGDEVWWEDSIKQVYQTIQEEGEILSSIVNPYYNAVGDIFHYQDQSAGRYTIDGETGHLNIRAINFKKIPGLHFEKPHGQQGVYDQEGVLIQNRPKKYRKFLNAPYMHFTNVIRSSSRAFDLKVPKRDIKLKYDLGIPFPQDFHYPEVFYKERPKVVPDPWQKRSPFFVLRGLAEKPIREIKRRLPIGKVGY